MTFPPWAAAHMNLLLAAFFGVAAVVLAFWCGYTEGRCSGHRVKLADLMRMQAARQKRDAKTGRFEAKKP